jgi:Uma2 family endonuclease
MSRQAKTLVTPEEYLAFERAAEYKNEYFDGEIFAMVGASRRHNLITLNVAAEFRAKLRGRGCETYASDMRVRISSANLYTYPDVVVVCGEPQFEDQHVDTLLNPTLIVEVLSKSTARYDRGAKFHHYRALESLQEYLMIAQDEPRIEHYAKQPDGQWLLSDIGLDDGLVELASIECVLELKDVYEQVEIE